MAGVPRSYWVETLGCPKNQVDTEIMLGQVTDAGHALVDTPEDADVIVVNTCAFIDSAKAESVNTILEMAEFKKGRAGKLVVTGMYDARLDGKPIRMAPGMRLFSPQNTLVQAHTVLEKPFTVNYVLENSTGMLLTAWILGKEEAAQKRPGASGRSFLWFGAD